MRPERNVCELCFWCDVVHMDGADRESCGRLDAPLDALDRFLKLFFSC